ncbi:beta-lactamase/transpeptidase-like protein [Massariosphaeria phaeospora]|uniref:Beta-lactamase/transpeptidase-like protein n=1 Tax=Massariosphaeria phaeospora TaxID=100035 RepID=A0A7C8M4S4_9PLEO|nr:beta-lactamase/transpeptidase-like protein [Massariosphaeria phaeospora]
MSSRRSSFTVPSESPPSTTTSRSPFSRSSENGPSEFDRRVTEAMAHWHVPGLAIAVVDNTHITAQGYGVTRLQPSGQAAADVPLHDQVTPQTLFDCASMSKSFTAAAMALLVQDEETMHVQWTTPVNRLLEDFVMETKAATEQVTVEDILCHRSGLPRHDDTLHGSTSPTPDTPLSITRNIRNLPLSAPLRTKYQYNNILYTVASHAVESLSATPYACFLATRFWEPLKMTRTFHDMSRIPRTERPFLSERYDFNPAKQTYASFPHLSEPEGQGAGSIISSVEDIARWLCAFIQRSGPLTPASYTDLRTPRILASDPDIPFHSPAFYALGWEVVYYHGHTLVRHDGMWAGHASSMLFIPSVQWGVVMMGNSESAEHVNTEVAWHLISDVLDVPREKRFDWRVHLEKTAAKTKDMLDKFMLFPELRERLRQSEVGVVPRLKRFVGVYENAGYRKIGFVWDVELGALVADCSERAFPFRIVVREHVADCCFVAEVVGVVMEDAWPVRCQFDVGDGGKCERVGLALCDEYDGLIWFGRLD